MINLFLRITNPWRRDEFSNVYCKSGLVTTHKMWEFQIYRHSIVLIDANISVSWEGSDHAGSGIQVGLLGVVMSFNVNDTRHWDYENNCWEIYKD